MTTRTPPAAPTRRHATHSGEGRGRVRRTAFFAWAAALSLLSGLTFTGVTALTIGLWLADRNPDTTPVTDLGFFALGAVIITTGFVVQLRAPERHIAGLQQAAVGLFALGVAGLIGERIEPLTGAAILIVATAALVALHPVGHAFFALGPRPSPRLAALALAAAVPAGLYALTMLGEARRAGPSCFLGRCAYGDRFAEMAALAIATMAMALLAAFRPEGWHVTAWSAGAAAALVGAASLAWPDLPGSLGWAGGAIALVWGALFVAVAEGERHRRVPQRLPPARGERGGQR